MATRHTNAAANLAVAPAVTVLFLWMIVPLGMTIWFSLLRYNLLDPGNESFVGLLNYEYFLTDPAFFAALGNTLKLVGGVLVLTVVGGILFALSEFIVAWGIAFYYARKANAEFDTAAAEIVRDIEKMMGGAK